MRKSIALGLAGVLVMVLGLVVGSRSVSADNGPHTQNFPSTTDACAGCHRAHTGSASYLLVQDEASICMSCHDGTNATTNVRDGVAFNLPSDEVGGGSVVGALRGGGFVNARIKTDDDSYRVSVKCKESLDGTTQANIPGTSIPCDDGDKTPLETTNQTVSVCGHGADRSLPANWDGNCSTWFGYRNSSDNAIVDTAHYQSPQTWPLHIDVLTGAAAVTSRHTLGTENETVWGSGAQSTTDNKGFGLTTNELECTSCHNQHGNGQYRILRPTPSLSGLTTYTFSGGVTVPDSCPTAKSGTGWDTTTSCVAATDFPVAAPYRLYTTPNYMNSTYVEYTTGSGGAAGIACTEPANAYTLTNKYTAAPGNYMCTDGDGAWGESITLYPQTLPGIPCVEGDAITVAPYNKAGYVCPNVKQAGGSLEDINGNGILDVGEDLNANGILDPYTAEDNNTTSGASAAADDNDNTYFYPNLDGMWPTADSSPTNPSGISAWCSQCHQRYLGRSVYNKDSEDGIFTFRHSSEGTLAYNGRQCNACHVSHGTNAATSGFADSVEAPGGGVWPTDGSIIPAVITSNNSRLLRMDNRGMCLKCHGSSLNPTYTP